MKWCFTFLLLIFASATKSQKSLQPIIATIQNFDPGNVTEKCAKQVKEYQQNLRMDETSWALQMLDATSKLQSGILSLNLGELGNFDQCIQVRTNQSQFGEILGKYCLGFVTISNVDQDNSNKSQQFKEFFEILGAVTASGRLQGPTWAICLPNGCSADDANILVNTLLQSLIGNQGLGIGFSELFCQTSKEVNPELSGGAITTITILALLLVTVLASTSYDIHCFFYGKEPKHVTLIAFSAYTNGNKIFKMVTPGPDQFPCLDGLRLISMVWVIASHSYSIPPLGPIVNTKFLIEWSNSLYSMFIVSGTLSVDTFFVVGGCLMGYGYMKARQKKIPINPILYYLHRYIRLTPPLAVSVLVSSTLLVYMGSGPKWPIINMAFQQNCVNYWWSTLLYVQNYVNITTMCIGQTWYLDIDMQLYLISPIVFTILWKWPRIGLSLITAAILASTGVNFYLGWSKYLPAIISNFYEDRFDFSNKYYLLTHTRAAPWLIGTILGYLIFKIKHHHLILKISTINILLLWAICLAVLLACVLGGHSTLRDQTFDRWGNSLHIALVRPIWSIGISWIILACVLGYGGPVNWVLSLPIYQVLNRFTYSMYLTHVTMLYMIVSSKKTPDYFNDFFMAFGFWGNLWFSAGLSALLVFGVESPMIALEKVIFGNARTKRKIPDDVEGGVDNMGYKK